MSEKQQESPAKRPRGQPTGAQWESWIDQLIREAQDRGDFDNLRGRGQPLPNRRNPFLPEDRQIVYDLLQNSGHTLSWLDEGKDIERRIEKARQQLARDYAWRQEQNQKIGRTEAVEAAWERRCQRFEQELNEINRQIDTYNLTAPSPQFHKYRLRLEEEYERLNRTG